MSEPDLWQWRYRVIDDEGTGPGEWCEWRNGHVPGAWPAGVYETEERPLFALSHTRDVVVKARELVWNPFRAETMVGGYYIDDQTDRNADELEGREPFLLRMVNGQLYRFSTLVAARSFAQADFNARVLALIEENHVQS